MLVELPPRARQRDTPPGCSPTALMQLVGLKESYDTAGSAGEEGFTDPRKSSPNLGAVLNGGSGYSAVRTGCIYITGINEDMYVHIICTL